jgi:hypothetical protein
MDETKPSALPVLPSDASPPAAAAEALPILPPNVSGYNADGSPHFESIAGRARALHQGMRGVIRRYCQELVHRTRGGERALTPSEADAMLWRLHFANMTLEMIGQTVIADWDTVIDDDRWRQECMQEALDAWAASVGAAHAVLKLSEFREHPLQGHRPQGFKLVKSGIGEEIL